MFVGSYYKVNKRSWGPVNQQLATALNRLVTIKYILVLVYVKSSVSSSSSFFGRGRGNDSLLRVCPCTSISSVCPLPSGIVGEWESWALATVSHLPQAVLAFIIHMDVIGMGGTGLNSTAN